MCLLILTLTFDLER